jgi:hypothetical protein
MTANTVDLSRRSKKEEAGVEMLFEVQEKNIHTTLIIIPAERFVFAQQSPRRSSWFVMMILATAAASFILSGLVLPIVLWIVSLIVQTLQRQEQEALLQEGSTSTLSSSSSSSSPQLAQYFIMLAQQVYQTACYWTYHVVPRLTSSLLTLYICLCLAHVGWLKLTVVQQPQQQQRSVRVPR